MLARLDEEPGSLFLSYLRGDRYGGQDRQANLDVGRYEAISTEASANLAVFRKGPFGGTLGLRFLFSPALLTGGIRWYRIKYRLNEAGAWRPLTHTVVRHHSNWNTTTSSVEFLPYHLANCGSGWHL